MSWAGECVVPFGGAAAFQFLGRDMVEKGRRRGEKCLIMAGSSDELKYDHDKYGVRG